MCFFHARGTYIVAGHPRAPGSFVGFSGVQGSGV